VVQKQINNFVQINCTDNFNTADVTTRLLMDFGCVPGDQKKRIRPNDIFVFYNDDEFRQITGIQEKMDATCK